MTQYFPYLAIAGAILIYLARRRIKPHETELSHYWFRAFRIVPFAEIFFAASHWEQPKMRSSVAVWIIGFSLCMPFAVEKLQSYERNRLLEKHRQRAAIEGDFSDSDTDTEKAMAELRLWQMESRLEALNRRMIDWYNVMNARRQAIASAPPAEIEAFNHEAAAYAELLAITKNEAAEIARMKSEIRDLPKVTSN